MRDWLRIALISATFVIATMISALRPAVAQSNATDFEKLSKAEWNVAACGDNDPYNPRMTVKVTLQPGYVDQFADDAFARRYAEFIRDRSFAYCNDLLKQRKINSVSKLFQISISVPGTTRASNFGVGGVITFAMLPRNGDAFSKVYETTFANDTRDYLAAMKRENDQRDQIAAAKQAEDLQQQATKQRKQNFQQKFLSDYSLTGFSSTQVVKTNPFAIKGQKVAIVTTFNRMIGDGEAVFDGIVVRGVPNTMFRDPRWTILAIEVIGMEQVPALGNISAPIAKFLGAYLCNAHSCYDVMD